MRMVPSDTELREHRAQRHGGRLLGRARAQRVADAVRVGEHHAQQRGLRSEEHTSELQSRGHLVCRLLLEKKKTEKSTTDSKTKPGLDRNLARARMQTHE